MYPNDLEKEPQHFSLTPEQRQDLKASAKYAALKADPLKRTVEAIKDRANACRRIENELDAMQMRATNDYERSQINHLRMQMQAQRGEWISLLMIATGEA